MRRPSPLNRKAARDSSAYPVTEKKIKDFQDAHLAIFQLGVKQQPKRSIRGNKPLPKKK